MLSMGLLCTCLYIPVILINSLAVGLASDGVLSLPRCVTTVALHSNNFCQTTCGTQKTDFFFLLAFSFHYLCHASVFFTS